MSVSLSKAIFVKYLRTTKFQHAVIAVMRDGLTVTVDDVHCIQACVYLKADLFGTYHIHDAAPSPFMIRVPLNVLCVSSIDRLRPTYYI